LNDILKGGNNPFGQLGKEDEEEFEMFIHRLNEKNHKKEVHKEEEEHKSPLKKSRLVQHVMRQEPPPQIAVLDQSSIHHDLSHLTPV
jgi:hypothetical protein